VFCELAGDAAKHVAGNRYVFVVESADPQAETHLLVAPRDHVASLATASQGTILMLVDKLRHVATERGLEGYRVVVNVGAAGKQRVPHLHLHLLAGPEVLEEGFTRRVR
jgi:histidine triad (HIT) family protein